MTNVRSSDTAARWTALVVLCLVQFMLVLDDTAVNVALPSIRAELGFDPVGLAWVVNGYFLAFGGFLLLFGRAGDLLGRRRLFLAGVVVFATASLACAYAQEPWQLVAGRFAQGTGAAMTSPAALALITLLFPDDRGRTTAFGIWGAISALGGSTGLIISGLLTGSASWRWIFLINAPVAALALALVPRLVVETRRPGRARLDLAGALLGTGAVTALIYGLLALADPAGSPVVGFAVAVVLAAAFVAAEVRASEPLVPKSLLSSRVRLVGNAANLVLTAALVGTSVLIMLHLQTTLGYQPLAAAAGFLPYGAAVLAGVAISSLAVRRLGLGPTVVTAFLSGAGGLLLLSGVTPDNGYIAGVLPGLLVTALGCGLGYPAITAAGLARTTGDNAGIGSALLNTGQQIGGAVGLAILLGIAVRGRTANAAEAAVRAALIDGIGLALLVGAALLGLGAVIAATLPRTRQQLQPDA